MENIELVDIGANLTHKDFSADLDSVIEEALNNNISKIIVTGTTGQESFKAANLTKNYPKILYSTAVFTHITPMIIVMRKKKS